MYKLIVVDDEEIVREGIEHNIEWSDLGFEFVGSFENGVDAVAGVDELRPAVIITDICMPYLDGLDLTQHVLAQYPRTKVVLLTGFGEFEYAQRAVKLGAYDYVLKPITAAELRALLSRLREKLDDEARQSAKLLTVSREQAEARETHIREITERIISGGLSTTGGAPAEIADELRSAGVTLPAAAGVVLVASFDRDQAIASAPSLLSSAEVFGGIECSSFIDHDDRFVAIVCGETERLAGERASIAAREMVAKAPGRFDRSLTIGVGGSFSSVEGFRASYREAVRCVEYRFVVGGARVITSRDLPRSIGEARGGGSEWSPSFRSAASTLVRALWACDRDEAGHAIELLTAEMADDFMSQARLRLQVHAILVRISDLRSEVDDPPIAIDALEEVPSLDAVRRRLREICASFIETRIRHRETYGGSKAEEACDYIEMHYAWPALTLGALCSELGVSPSYFSSIFKSHVGKTFVEYLTQVRVDHAKQLLSTTDLKSYQVAERVGYADQHYFSSLFKKATGRSPTEFRHDATIARIVAHE